MSAINKNAARRPWLGDWLWVALIGLLVQAFWAARMQHPSYMDAYYYATNGQRLANGYGFTELVIWQFLDNPAGLPAPSHTYWMPLPSILAAAGYIIHAGFRGAQLPFWLLAGALPLLAYFISQLLTGQRWQAWTAALFTASGGFYNNFFNQPSTFAPFAWFGGGCLLALAAANRSPAARGWWFLAGVLAGLAHLTRADGFLLLLVGGWIGLLAMEGRNQIRVLWPRLLGRWGVLLAGYLLVMGGWFIHNWIRLGRPLSSVGVQTIFLTTYDDLFAYGRTFDLAHFGAWGGVNIWQSKVEGLWLAAQTFTAVNCLIFLTPFVLIGWRRLARSASTGQLLRPFSWYAVILYASMSLVFTLPGGRGGLFHSSAALWPWLMALAAAGIEIAVYGAARRLPHWKPERASRKFAAIFVALAFIMSLALGVARTPPHDEVPIYEAIEQQLPAEAVVMVGDAPGFHYHTGRPAVSVPNEPAPILVQAAARYGVTHLVLDPHRPRPLEPLYQSDLQLPAVQLVQGFNGIKLYEFVYEDE